MMILCHSLCLIYGVVMLLRSFQCLVTMSVLVSEGINARVLSLINSLVN